MNILTKNNKFIYILSAGIKKDINGNWKTSDLFEKEDTAPGGRSRILAAYYLYKENQKLDIVVSGGQGSDKNVKGIIHPDISKIMKKELIEIGVPSRKIKEESNSLNTFEQLVELQNIIKDKNIKQAILISNKYHLPRIKAMINSIDILRKLKASIEIKDAEDILLKHNQKKWSKIIKEAYGSKEMLRVSNSEEKGVKDIRLGRYKF